MSWKEIYKIYSHMNLKQYKYKQLENPDFRREYNRYDLAFEVGLLIMRARIRRGMTQGRLAELAETKQSSIARAERGTSPPSLSFLIKIAKALKTCVTVNFALFEKENRVETKDMATLWDTSVLKADRGNRPLYSNLTYTDKKSTWSASDYNFFRA